MAIDLQMMIETALEAGSVARLHPNQFLQLDLTPNQRLHIWSPDLPQAQKVRTPIHNHVFDFTSEVLIGRLVHQIYVWKWDGELHYTGENTHQLWGASREPYVPNLRPWGIYGRAEKGDCYTLSAGSVYTFTHDLFHDSYSDRLTMTILTKTGQVGGEPFVAIPLGVEPDNDFKRHQYEHKFLMKWFWLALERYKDGNQA